MDYTYENLEQEPCLDFIVTSVLYSAMTDKALEGQRFDWLTPEEDDGTLHVTFESELSVDDKAIFDGIVTASLGKTRITKDRETIMAEILTAAQLSGDPTQLPRLLDALDNYTSIPVSLDNCNYPLARSRVDKALADGAITEADRTLVNACIPESEFTLA
jgi:hypothetical protein